MLIGTRTIGKDEISYRSKFEAMFANKFLFGKFNYAYEKPYDDGTKSMCDFYIYDLDLYIELVYRDNDCNVIYMTNLGLGYDVPLKKAKYEDREVLKMHGCKWDPSLKEWYIPSKIGPNKRKNRMFDLEKFMTEEYLGMDYNGNADDKTYHETLEKKYRTNCKDKTIIQVHLKDLKGAKSLYDIIRTTNNALYKEKFAHLDNEIKTVLIPKNTMVKDFLKLLQSGGVDVSEKVEIYNSFMTDRAFQHAIGLFNSKQYMPGKNNKSSKVMHQPLPKCDICGGTHKTKNHERKTGKTRKFKTKTDFVTVRNNIT